MARPKEFDTEKALDAALEVFREHGFEGASASMLVEKMGIGRQSLYDTFGDKWQLYQAALRRYTTEETGQHIEMLRSKPRAIEGLRAMVRRVVAGAHQPCLGVSSICEFGIGRPELVAIRGKADGVMRAAMIEAIGQAQAEGDISPVLSPETIASFITANFAGIRIAARGGAGKAQLKALGELALRALG
ncbi:MAG: TetR/AcrR family transcriptional regulator [Rhizobiaceae bacterium]|nr:MAG: TetR/AcrR family transcriptional regulator [Rhizobiaceae bacterium]